MLLLLSRMQETLSIKVTPAETAHLMKLAQARGVKISTVLKEVIQLAAAGATVEESPTCYERFARYFEEPGRIGASGTGDLSVNKARLDGFGRSRNA